MTDRQCRACSGLFLVAWVDSRTLALSRFDKLNKARLLEGLTPGFLSGCQDVKSLISHLCLYLHSASLSTLGSTRALLLCSRKQSCSRLAINLVSVFVSSTHLSRVICFVLLFQEDTLQTRGDSRFHTALGYRGRYGC